MKRNWKAPLVGGAALAILVGTMTISSLATVGRTTAYLDYQNMRVTLNGTELDLRDSKGNKVEPFTIDGTTYLPLATISKALGVNVAWDGNTKTVILTTDGSTPTTTTPTTSTPSTGSYIGEAKAKEIALNHAGVSASNASFLFVEADYDNGRKVYEVEFYSGNKEYDYEIDASTGSIVSYDYDAERYTPQQSTTGSYIGETKAKQIVEQKAGTTGTYREFKLERDDGRMVYEGELRNGRTDYEFKIDAVSGTILEWDVDWD